MERVNILLDTTFVLPLFGVDVILNHKENVKKIWLGEIKDIKFLLSSISLIEVMYKLNREYRIKNDKTILERYETLLPLVLRSENVQLINSHLDPLSNYFMRKLRELGHSDLMDCWIMGSALANECIFLTQEKTLKKVLKKGEFLSKVDLWNWDKFIRFITQIS